MAAASLDESKAKNVLRQVEFYFSDSNFPRHKFLYNTVQESQDGCILCFKFLSFPYFCSFSFLSFILSFVFLGYIVFLSLSFLDDDKVASLALICSFSRMKSHLGLSNDVTPESVPEDLVMAVAEVLRQSSSLQVSEDGKRIGRRTELLKMEEVIEQVDVRTVAVSPLPNNIKWDEVESFFAQHAKVNSVRLPRHVSDKRQFCGTALVEFSEENDANDILNKSFVFAGAVLELKPKKQFDTERDRKKKEYEYFRLNKNASDESYPRGLILSFTLKSMTDTAEQGGDPDKDNNSAKNSGPEVLISEASASEQSTRDNTGDNQEKSSTDGVKEHGEQEGQVKASETDAEENPKISENEGSKGLSDESGDQKVASADGKSLVMREDIKQLFQKFRTVKFIDYKMGADSGYIRFEDPEEAVKARAVADDGGLVVKSHILTLDALTGEAEKNYWDMLRSDRDRARENKKQKGRGGKNNRGGRQFYNKRRFHPDSSDLHPNKAKKVDASA